MRKYKQEYYRRPEAKQHQKKYLAEYNQRPEVKQRHKEWLREYKQRPEVKQRHKEWLREYKQRPEVKQRNNEWLRKYNQRPEVKQKLKLNRRENIIPRLIKQYTKKLNKTNAQIAQIKRIGAVPSIFLEGKQIQIQNIINNLKIIKEHTKNLPKEIRAETTDRMLNNLLSTEGNIVSWRKPLQNVYKSEEE
jgi:hypothetical protein